MLIISTEISAQEIVPPAEVEQLIVGDSGLDVILNWMPVTEDMTGVSETVIGYRIFGSLDEPDFVPGTPLNSRPSTAPFTHSGAFADSNDYFYLVSAVDTGGIPGSAAPPTITAPSILSLEYSGNAATVTWSAAAPSVNLQTYRVYWGPASKAYTSSVDVAAGTLSKVISGLSPPATYYFAVVGVDHKGNLSGFDTEASLTLAGSAPPGISATASPEPNEHGWNNTDVTVSFACVGGGMQSEVDPVACSNIPGVSFTLCPLGSAVDEDTSSFEGCQYSGASACGAHYDFAGGVVQGRARVKIGDDGSSTDGKTTVAYSVDGGRSWSEFGSARPAARPRRSGRSIRPWCRSTWTCSESGCWVSPHRCSWGRLGPMRWTS